MRMRRFTGGILIKGRVRENTAFEVYRGSHSDSNFANVERHRLLSAELPQLRSRKGELPPSTTNYLTGDYA